MRMMVPTTTRLLRSILVIHFDRLSTALLLLLVIVVSSLVFPSLSQSVPTTTAFCVVERRPSSPHHHHFNHHPPQFGTTSALKVSELHVPGYAQSKLAFIHPEDNNSSRGWPGEGDGSNNNGGTALLRPRTYRPNIDYTSLLPHQNNNGHLIHRTTIPIFTPRECQSIIDEAEAKASEMGWTTTRHGNHPTTDLPIVELGATLQFFKVALVERIYPLLRQQFGEFLPDGGRNLRVADGFVVKYDATSGGQTELKPHRDGSVLSFNIALNSMSEYDGGGTRFSSLPPECCPVVKIDRGQLLSHASSLLHAGHGITRGTRYIMVCFVILEGYDSWSMRFYNQVRNL